MSFSILNMAHVIWAILGRDITPKVERLFRRYERFTSYLLSWTIPNESFPFWYGSHCKIYILTAVIELSGISGSNSEFLVSSKPSPKSTMSPTSSRSMMSGITTSRKTDNSDIMLCFLIINRSNWLFEPETAEIQWIFSNPQFLVFS